MQARGDVIRFACSCSTWRRDNAPPSSCSTCTGYGSEEAARIMGIAPSTVRGLATQGRAVLRRTSGGASRWAKRSTACAGHGRSEVAYTDPNGLHIVDVATGETSLVTDDEVMDRSR
jgi:hypothetical protein